MQNKKSLQIADGFRTVIINGERKNLRYKESQILEILVKNYPSVATKEMFSELWIGTYVLDGTVKQIIKNLRKALDDKNKKIVITAPRKGYLLGIAPQVIKDEHCNS